MTFDNFYLIGGYRFPDELGSKAEEALKFKYLGKIVADQQVDDFVLDGKSLLDVPSDNPAYTSVKAIMKTTGYIQQ
jgi:hypothetical protein